MRTNPLMFYGSFVATPGPITLTSGMFSQSGLTSFTAANLIDGSTSTRGFHTDGAAAGSYLKIDFGAGNDKRVTKVEIYIDGWAYPTWDLQYSSDGSSWTNCYTGLTFGSGTPQWYTANTTMAVSARYIRLYNTAYSAAGTGWHCEIKLTGI